MESQSRTKACQLDSEPDGNSPRRAKTECGHGDGRSGLTKVCKNVYLRGKSSMNAVHIEEIGRFRVVPAWAQHCAYWTEQISVKNRAQNLATRFSRHRVDEREPQWSPKSEASSRPISSSQRPRHPDKPRPHHPLPQTLHPPNLTLQT